MKKPEARLPIPRADKPLTAREKEIIVAVSDGHGNRDIALLLGISFWTVKTHLTNIRDKTGCDTRTQIAAKFLRGELV